MFSKTCPICGEESYSSCEKQWICPNCGANMDDVEINESM